MEWRGLLGFFLLLNQSIKAEQYIVSNDSTTWLLPSCDLAEPRLAYKNAHFKVAEEIEVLSNNAEAWIGYVSVKVPFLFHASLSIAGCAQVQNTMHTTYIVRSIGYCQTLCGHYSPFGIKAPNGLDILNPASLRECICFNTSVHKLPLGHFDNDNKNLCEKDCYAIFTQISADDSWVINSGTGNTDDCLTYRYSGFQWQSCVSENNLKVICSIKTTADPSARAYVSTPLRNTWIQGNLICLKENMYPASITSILLSRLNVGHQLEHWTGIVRAATLTNKAGLSSFGPTQYSGVKYAFLKGSEKSLKFENNEAKRALCSSVNRAWFIPTSTEIPTQTRYTEGKATTTKSKEESPATGAGIGAMVVVLVVVGIGFTVVMLRRRGIILARFKNRAPDRTHDKHNDMLPNAASNVERVHKSVVNPNYFVLEKQTESVIAQLDHNNRLDDIGTDIIDENIYHSIDDPAAELRGNVKVDCSDYDCTTDGAATSRGKTHDNVYNKLKLDRQGKYEHVQGSCQINNITTNNDYDTTETLKAKRRLGNDAYDHVGDMGNAPAFSPSDDDYSSAVKCMTNARGSAAGLDKPDYSHGHNPFVKV